MLYSLLAGCGPLRAGEALGPEVDKHISPDFRTLSIQQKAKRGEIQPYLKTKSGERQVDLCCSLAKMLRELHRQADGRIALPFFDGCAASAIEHLKRQPPSHSRGYRTHEGWLQHLSPLPHHPSAKDGMPGSTPALLVWTRTEIRVRTLHQTPRRTGFSVGMGGEDWSRIRRTALNWATWATAHRPESGLS